MTNKKEHGSNMSAEEFKAYQEGTASSDKPFQTEDEKREVEADPVRQAGLDKLNKGIEATEQEIKSGERKATGGDLSKAGKGADKNTSKPTPKK